MKFYQHHKRLCSLLIVAFLLFSLLASPISSPHAAAEPEQDGMETQLSLYPSSLTLASLALGNYNVFLVFHGLPLLHNMMMIQALGSYFFIADTSHQALDVIEAETNEEVQIDDVYSSSWGPSLKGGISKEGEFYYYTEETKGLARGWRELDGKLYYFSPVDGRMYRNGMFSTGEGVYWFGEDGAVKEGERLGGHVGLPIVWKLPSPEELKNKWLEGENQELRFRGQEIANYAASFEGLPFKWFGNDLGDESGVYCCGTVYSAHQAFGIHIPGPGDMDMELNEGFEMVQHQHDRVGEFGGVLIDNDLTKLLPGDVVLHMSPLSPIEYTHVGIFMGYNGDTPYYLHATIKDGVIVESVHMANEEWGAWFSDKFMRYNTEQNKGLYPYPRHQRMAKDKTEPLLTEAEEVQAKELEEGVDEVAVEEAVEKAAETVEGKNKDEGLESKE